jgi:hypothetical protein
MFKNKEKITFTSTSDHVWEVRERPIPASDLIPVWWKDSNFYATVEQKFMMLPAPNHTMKKCLPLLDGLGSGYIMPLWTDLLVNNKDGRISIQQGPQENATALDVWDPIQVSKFEIDDNFEKTVFKYLHGWIIKTPPDWSCLITHPLGYPNLPIKSISGVVDTDKLDVSINAPFLIKKGFSGIIEKGTPMFQIIPIKRTEWESEFIKENENKNFFNSEKFLTKLVSPYGRTVREPKNYN